MDRNEVLLDLSRDSDVRKYLDHLSHIEVTGPIGSFSEEEIKSGIKFLISETNSSWGIVNRRGQIAIQTIGEERSFLGIDHIALLGISLRILRSQRNFDRVLQKLNSRSREKLHVIPEILAAASYVRSGYEIKLEPGRSENEPSPDFAVLKDEDWIFFECKMVDSIHSISFQKFFQRVGKYGNWIYYILEELLGNNEVRVEIELRKRFTDYELEAHIFEDALRALRDSLEGKQFQKVELHKDQYTIYINDRKDPVSIKPEKFHLAIGMEDIEKKNAISCADARVVISLDPFGYQEIKKISRLLARAKKQIPNDSLGQIVLLTREILPHKFFLRKLQHPSWNNVIGILNIAHDEKPKLFLNKTCVEFDQKFLEIPLGLIGNSIPTL